MSPMICRSASGSPSVKGRRAVRSFEFCARLVETLAKARVLSFELFSVSPAVLSFEFSDTLTDTPVSWQIVAASVCIENGLNRQASKPSLRSCGMMLCSCAVIATNFVVHDCC